jgi:hypothetical protein
VRLYLGSTSLCNQICHLFGLSKYLQASWIKIVIYAFLRNLGNFHQQSDEFNMQPIGESRPLNQLGFVGW